ncbi:MAG: hypothetical protein Q8840_02185, partial [Sweet potato little leaf phytoplasma]|nr:hypothetical protein [Sweet potato little leaf phytoplasma]
LQYLFKQKELNLRERRWLELRKDYDINSLYHLSKGNIIADTLNRLSMGILVHLPPVQREIVRDIHKLANVGVRLVDSEDGGVVVLNSAESSLMASIKQRQYDDPLFFQYK